MPKYPSIFYRAPGSLVGHRQPIVRPRESEQLDYEGEIALVIGRTGRRIARERALDYVAGATLCNEGTHPRLDAARQIQRDAGQELGRQRQHRPLAGDGRRDRSRRSRCDITTQLNGEVTQDDTTGSMIKSFTDIMVYVSTFMTLKPGDIIATGTPVKLDRGAEPRWLKPGDVVEIEVPQIGVLRNRWWRTYE